MPLVCLYGRHVVLVPVLGSRGSLARVYSKGSHLVNIARARRGEPHFPATISLGRKYVEKKSSMGSCLDNWANGEQGH